MHLLAKADESYLGRIDTSPSYVVAAYLAPHDQWRYFSQLWTASMSELHIASTGAHASKCERGRGPYARMPETQRKDILYRLIVDIAAAGLHGCVSIVDLPAYGQFAPTFERLLAVSHFQQYNRPHVLAVRHCAQESVLITERKATIDFVFDQNNAFGRRAIAFLEMDMRHPTVTYSSCLGTLQESSRIADVGLQAADLLAYYHLRHSVGDEPWLWKELNDAGPIHSSVAGERFWAPVAEGLERFVRENVRG